MEQREPGSIVSSEKPPSRIHGRKVLLALADAGIIRNDEYVRRVIIDLPVDGAAVMYVEWFADHRLLDLVHTLGGIEIRTQEVEARDGTS